MKKILLLFVCFGFMQDALSQRKAAYIIYNSKGRKVSYQKMIRTISKNEILLFGEFHNNPISHWLQLEVTKDLHQKKKIVLGAEMIETDNQKQLNDYLRNKIDAVELDSTSRMWKNFKTDYKPLVDYAKSNQLKFIATNIPRRYASIVFKSGFEGLNALPENDKQWIAPLPIKYDAQLPGYVAMMEMMGGHGGENLPKAQAIKDATMAYNIWKNKLTYQYFIHYNGAYHSKDFEGIYWYLKQKNSEMKVSTITTVSQENPFKLLEEYKGEADFIICVDEDMTTTY